MCLSPGRGVLLAGRTRDTACLTSQDAICVYTAFSVARPCDCSHKRHGVSPLQLQSRAPSLAQTIRAGRRNELQKSWPSQLACETLEVLPPGESVTQWRG